MSFKTLIFFGLLAVALGFTLPEENLVSGPSEWVYGDVVPVSHDLVLVRRARSPQGSVSGTFEHSRPMGSSATIDYNHRLSKNLDVYAGASRNFKFNDNSGHAGLRYRF
ncbi:uncharacterized protein LOC129940803 [Eupeodes corollae]|uniref:uncharacterized protein LOC129940803 n=1 Tax=Eupeodes corollae TaxID=290404 RepID=UPI0024920FD8|nr:uncharacterized protein LOC129940803 [Eupeodes corollae]XP_055905273.1 uncharacterized protein LOC129940803 [Eupeodes corollae]